MPRQLQGRNGAQQPQQPQQSQQSLLFLLVMLRRDPQRLQNGVSTLLSHRDRDSSMGLGGAQAQGVSA